MHPRRKSWHETGNIHSRPASTDRLRRFAIKTLSFTKRAPPKPPTTPKSRKTDSSQLSHSFFALFVGVDILKNVSWLEPFIFQLFNVKLDAKLPAKAKSNERWLKARIEPSSSTAKSTPPIGAPKAVDTPAAAPMQITSCNGTKAARAPSGPLLVCSTYAQLTPICISGPSFPSASPAPTERESPTALTSRQTLLKLLEIEKPATAAFTSGIPLPFAAGA
mmetsp:Transcript_19520/g.31290  ORF Transcript_19520/g.31290 Transcript_19520/m.31290 type:complete len:220 (+) Transcript_19520:495-1154(+)